MTTSRTQLPWMLLLAVILVGLAAGIYGAVQKID
jgi:hypothetical protein